MYNGFEIWRSVAKTNEKIYIHIVKSTKERKEFGASDANEWKMLTKKLTGKERLHFYTIFLWYSYPSMVSTCFTELSMVVFPSFVWLNGTFSEYWMGPALQKNPLLCIKSLKSQLKKNENRWMETEQNSINNKKTYSVFFCALKNKNVKPRILIQWSKLYICDWVTVCFVFGRIGI